MLRRLIQESLLLLLALTGLRSVHSGDTHLVNEGLLVDQGDRMVNDTLHVGRWFERDHLLRSVLFVEVSSGLVSSQALDGL